MDIKDRYNILQKHLIQVYSSMIEKITDASDVKAIDDLIAESKDVIELHRKSYAEDIRKIFAQQKIEKLNEKPFLTDEDCRTLVIGGFDELSKYGSVQLYEMLQKNLGIEDAGTIMDMLTEAFGGNTTAKSRAMRWVIRGLSVDHSIAKIHYDLKIYKN